MTHLDDYQRQRLGTLRPIMEKIARAENQGLAFAEAAARIGGSWRSIRTIYFAWRKGGDRALVDHRKLKRAAAAPRVALTADDRKMLRQFALQTDSVQFAIEAFADSEHCRQELRDFISRYRATRNYPTLLRRAARVSSHERDLARGNKTFSRGGWVQFRANKRKDAAGVEHPLLGGDLFECDDMSLNQPYWYEWPYGGDPLSDRFGVRLGRQVLISEDVARFKILGFDLIGRVRDAYRGEDVVRFLGRICETHGIPRFGFRLERGAWAARAVRGVKGANDDQERETIGSVRDVVDLHYVHESRSKGCIEGSFDMLQTILALEGIQIGRTRGEFEKTTSLMLAINAGRKHPADYGFPHISEAAERLARGIATFNARPKLGRLFRGVPQDAFTDDVLADPLIKVPDDKAHLFCPVKQVRPIVGGHVRVHVPHYQHKFSFQVPPSCAGLGAGYRLLVCFDPAEPHAGARVFDAETDARRDFHATAGQSYGIFTFSDDAPQIDASRSGDFSGKRAYLAAARTSFRATGMAVGTGASIDQITDGRGNVSRIERGTERPVADRRSLATAAMQTRRTAAERGGQTARDTAADLLISRDRAEIECPYDL